MSHNKHTKSNYNKDLENFTRKDYLAMSKHFKSSFDDPIIEEHEGFHIVREDYLEVGSKARFGELLFSTIKKPTIVYVQPRFGFAGVSLVKLKEMYNKKLILFMPASKIISEHQAYCIEKGAIPIFKRIAAMPNLNRIAKKYAESNNSFFIPFGLTHELVTSMIVKTCDEFTKKHGQPKRVWCAISTGVLCRGIQIGWPNAKLFAVAVARNIKDGEKGRAKIFSHHKSFHQTVNNFKIPFDSALNYDAKAYEYMKKYGQKGDLMWNVAGNLKSKLDKTTIKSQKGWNE